MIPLKGADSILGRTGKRNCVLCKSENLSLAFFISNKGIPPGLPGHEISYSHVIVNFCNDCGSGILEKLIHDCFDFDDVWDQYEWYVLDKNDTELLNNTLNDCPDPLSPKCYCDIHRSLRSSVFYLPVDSWNWSLEGEHHVRKVSLNIMDGLPRFETDKV